MARRHRNTARRRRRRQTTLAEELLKLGTEALLSPSPPSPLLALPPTYADAASHRELLQAACVEEARATLSAAGLSALQGKRAKHDALVEVVADAEGEAQGQHGLHACVMRVRRPARDSARSRRPGAAFLLTRAEASAGGARRFVGLVDTRQESWSNTSLIPLQTNAFAAGREEEDIGGLRPGSIWLATALGSILSCARMHHALANLSGLPFEHRLLGGAVATHRRFNDDGERVETVLPPPQRDASGPGGLAPGSDVTSDAAGRAQAALQRAAARHTTRLNGSQRGVLAALERGWDDLAGANQLVLVQGPPGTGKTTTVVSMLLHAALRLTEAKVPSDAEPRARDGQGRIVVCAPSNAATQLVLVEVLRALQTSLGTAVGYVSALPVILVGVDEHVAPPEPESGSHTRGDVDWDDTGGDRSLVRAHFVHSFADEVLRRLRRALTVVPTARQARSLGDAVAWVRAHCRVHAPRFWREHLRGPAKALRVALAQGADGTAAADLRNLVEPLDRALTEARDNELLERELTSHARLVFSTLSSAGRCLVRNCVRSSDLLLVDEAGQAPEPEALIPMASCRPKRVVLIGDPCQLPALVISPHAQRAGFARSLLARLMAIPSQRFFALNVQYRMRPELAAFPGEHFYGSIGLVTHGTAAARADPWHGQAGAEHLGPLNFIHVDGHEAEDSRTRSLLNPAEVGVAVRLVRHLRDRWGHPVADRKSFAILAFYSAQRAAILAALAAQGLQGVCVSTVDSFQGSESRVVLVCFTRAPRRDGRAGSVGFLQDWRRVNVGITRAQTSLVLIGHMQTLTAGKGHVASSVAALVRACVDGGRLHAARDIASLSGPTPGVSSPQPGAGSRQPVAHHLRGPSHEGASHGSRSKRQRR